MEGELLGVTATDALELGIDIGLLDCAISVGFPGTVASLRQQWGRAGRRGHGLAVLVASEDALDQYFMREPETLLGRRVEAAILDHANPRVLDGHVLSAAFEAPLDDADRETLGDEALRRAPRAAGAAAGRERLRLGRPRLSRRPHRRCGRRARTRSPSSTPGRAPCWAWSSANGRTRPSTRARSTSTSARQYLVTRARPRRPMAVVEPFRGDWYTQAKKETMTAIDAAERVERRLGLELTFGRVSVTEQVVAYQEDDPGRQTRLDSSRSTCRRRRFETEAIWYLPEPEMLEGLETMPRLLGTLHAAEHTMIALLPLWAMCDRWDIGGLSTNLHFQTGRPTVFIYDGHPGGVGITERGFERLRGLGGGHGQAPGRLSLRARCPSCVQSPKCGNLNDMLDKDGALTLLRRMLAHG